MYSYFDLFIFYKYVLSKDLMQIFKILMSLPTQLIHQSTE